MNYMECKEFIATHTKKHHINSHHIEVISAHIGGPTDFITVTS